MTANAGFDIAVARALATPGKDRAVGFRHEGRDYWLKRGADRGWFLRWQKGDPAILVERERRAIRALHAAGHPVPEVVAEGLGYFVMTDNGTPLDRVWDESPGERRSIALEGARALSRLHHSGVAHGSPHLRNMTRTANGTGFIDLEQARIGEVGPKAFRHDLGVYLYSLFGLRAEAEIVNAALGEYIAARGPQTANDLAAWLRSRSWMRPAVAGLAWHERRFKPRRRPQIYSAMLALDRLMRVNPTR